jgi:radical SAM-linked protein
MLLRVLRMTELKPAYSHGFHPHAKLSIALPLSLGYASDDEYFEFETESIIPDLTAATERLNKVLPKGIRTLSIKTKPAEQKSSLAALVSGVTYEIMAYCEPREAGDTLSNDDIRASSSLWLDAERIEIEKYNKKKKTVEILNVKGNIRDFKPANIWGNKIIFELKLNAENGNVQNPVKVFESFARFADLETGLKILTVKRIKILFQNSI